MDRTGWEEALRRIDAEREARTGTLDLAGLGLRALPPAIGELTWLEELDLGGYADGFADERYAFAWFDRKYWEGVGRVNPIRDLGLLSALGHLRRLDLSGTDVRDLDPLGRLPGLVSLRLDGSLVDDIEPLARLPLLETLHLSYACVQDLAPLATSSALRTLNLRRSDVGELAPLRTAVGLRSLDFAWTLVDDLRPLADLTDLRSLDCSRTQVSTLAPLMRLRRLASLSCAATDIDALDPLSSAHALVHLDCSGTHVSTLEPIRDCETLRHLALSTTNVSDLAPVEGLRALRYLAFDNTDVSDLRPLAALTDLETVMAGGTPVGDLTPLEDLPVLLALDCTRTAVDDLGPIVGRPRLVYLRAAGCALRSVPLTFLQSPRLSHLTATHIDGYPPELMSGSHIDSCLPRLRAHIADLQAGAEPYRTTKVIVLGNGRVGKTQLCRKLRGLDYDPAISSTHGIVIDTADFDDGETLNLWDFGGQDIYHGAHALFMRTRAVFVIAWHPDFEASPIHEHQGMTFRNRPLAYWLAFVQAMSAKGSPVIVVQARCDSRGHVAKRPPIPEAFLDEMDCRVVQYSAETDFGRRRLDAELADAIDAIRERDGIASIGAGRARVIDALQALREADRLRPAAERESRVLDMRRFVAICDAAGGVSSPRMLLHYLHQCGLLFYDPKRFGDRILLDISWALEAIYTLFDRETAWRQLHGSDGRFSAALLAATVWRDVEPEARALFVSLMQSCGICFRHGRYGDGIEPEYVAPDLLPERARITRHLQGRMIGAQRRFVHRYAFLHPGLFRGLMARVGGRSGDAGVYWQRGLWVYVPMSDTQVQIEVFPEGGEGYGGRIEIAMVGDDGELADWLREQLAELSRRFGLMALSPEVDELPIGPRQEPALTETGAFPPAEGREPAFGRMPPEAIKRPDPERPRVYVSYARQEGAALTKALHGALTAAGLEVVYDEVGAGFGDSIGAFMDALIEGDRVIVVLGEGYLRSPYCMYELYGIWQRARSDPRRFADKVLPLLLPDTDIDTLPARIGHARYWRTHFEVTQALVGIDPAAIAAGDLADFKRMQSYYLHVGDMLRALADTLMPRDLEALAAEGFAPLLALLGTQPAR